MRLDQKLVDAAIEQARSRFPTGEGGAAALYTSEGNILTSVFFDSPNEAANLCHETGAICEAFRRELKVTASVCVSRERPEEPFVILAPCGICQERLSTWGLDLDVAVPLESDPTRWEARKLREVHPFYWRNPWIDKTP